MLTVKYQSIEDSQRIYSLLGLDGKPFGSNFFMYDEEAPVALWRMRIVLDDEPVGIIDRIFFADSVEEDDKTFFLHAMFFKLIEGAPVRLRIEGVHPEFEKFGFKTVGDNMEAFSREINLHYGCRGFKG